MSVPAPPVVSVLMPLLNGERTLERCIESVLAQTFGDWELIIIDDGSTDGSHGIVRSFMEKDERITLVINKERKGLASSLNIGISSSRGTYIARIDADDRWDAHKLKAQLDFLDTHEGYGLVGTNAIIHDEETGRRTTEVEPGTDEEIKKTILFRNPFVHSSILVRKELLDTFGQYSTSIPYAEDYDLWFRLVFNTKCHNIQRPLVHRSINRDSVSARNVNAQRLSDMRIKLRYLPSWLSQRHPLFPQGR